MTFVDGELLLLNSGAPLHFAPSGLTLAASPPPALPRIVAGEFHVVERFWNPGVVVIYLDITVSIFCSQRVPVSCSQRRQLGHDYIGTVWHTR
jgi:hypothetical protein